MVLKTDSQDLVASFRVTTGTSNTTAIKSIEFARKGRWDLIFLEIVLKLSRMQKYIEIHSFYISNLNFWRSILKKIIIKICHYLDLKFIKFTVLNQHSLLYPKVNRKLLYRKRVSERYVLRTKIPGTWLALGKD